MYSTGRKSAPGRSYGGRSSSYGGNREGGYGSGGQGTGRGTARGGRETADSRTPRFIRKKACRLCGERVPAIDFKDTDRILKFMTEKGKILPQRISGNCTKHQRMLSKAVKRARHATLIAFQIGD